MNILTIKEFEKNQSLLLGYIDMFVNTVKKDYMLNKIDMYDYERRINILTVMRLLIESNITDMKDVSMKLLGGFVDVGFKGRKQVNAIMDANIQIKNALEGFIQTYNVSDEDKKTIKLMQDHMINLNVIFSKMK